MLSVEFGQVDSKVDCHSKDDLQSWQDGTSQGAALEAGRGGMHCAVGQFCLTIGFVPCV